MDAQVRRTLEMATRVREFSRAHPSTDPGYGIVVNRLEERLNRAEAIAATQEAGLVAARGARFHRSELRKELHFNLLRYLVAVGGVAAKTRAELMEQFKLPTTRGTNQGFITSAKGLLTRAEAEKALLLAEGMSPTLLDDLRVMVSELETASETARKGRRDHIGATGDFDLIVRDLMELVRVLDGLNRYRFRKDAESMVEWEAVRDVPFQSKAAKPVAGEVPPSTGGAGAAG